MESVSENKVAHKYDIPEVADGLRLAYEQVLAGWGFEERAGPSDLRAALMILTFAFAAGAYFYPVPFYGHFFEMTVLVAITGFFFLAVVAMDYYYRNTFVYYVRKPPTPSAAAAAAASSSMSPAAQARMLPECVHLSFKHVDDDIFFIYVRPGSPRAQPVAVLSSPIATWMFADGSFNLDRLRTDTVAALAAASPVAKTK
jgi:hypothetical protein